MHARSHPPRGSCFDVHGGSVLRGVVARRNLGQVVFRHRLLTTAEGDVAGSVANDPRRGGGLRRAWYVPGLVGAITITGSVLLTVRSFSSACISLRVLTR